MLIGAPFARNNGVTVGKLYAFNITSLSLRHSHSGPVQAKPSHVVAPQSLSACQRNRGDRVTCLASDDVIVWSVVGVVEKGKLGYHFSAGALSTFSSTVVALALPTAGDVTETFGTLAGQVRQRWT